ncbi:acyltransferase family protein [Turicibacter sanguinis]|uniref:acyltransferase family protein n=1 Tax=Turicibacter sanguinis TaxID=154288 RepID=UPI00232E796A|nr:acyltransferase [Turicibacter sanguinis]MDB8459165.1 acyltransferase [Turicibacter sanguinis]
MGQLEKKRDYKIDILRFIAIVCIIFAHTSPPGILFVLRNFDVTLMVMLMGTSYYLSNNGRSIDYKSYIIKRFNRLIIPTWIFLTIFFIVFYIISLLTKTDFEFGIKSIIASYSLMGGIGYVWIMRVFFLVAILNPIILYISRNIKSNVNYFIVLMAIYIVYLGLVGINSQLNGLAKLIFENIIVVSIGWGLIAAVGIRLKKLNKKELFLYAGIFLIIFIFLMIKYDFTSTQNYKYPPTMYYISYGLFVSFTLLLLLDIKCIYNIFNNKIVKYISVNSLWLYFWHIIPIYILSIYGESLPILNDNFISRFIFIFVFALILTISQQKIHAKIAPIK